ncbi:hypothetical protein BYT27DRAFT_6765955 [Phlegmacium glaucopus]|nr:hypothetical protein BYT27DRAFT_6765955 [Phlegmacium glaucopus]
MADSDVFGGCCFFIFSGLNTWCNTQTFGANGCCNSNTTAGCCGSCCNNSFNEDRFEEQVKENLEKTRDPNAPITSKPQLAPTPDMSAQGVANNSTSPTT